MKKTKLIIMALTITLVTVVIEPMRAEAAWQNDSTGWWYTNGSSYKTGWQNIDGNWYYFYSNGYMAHDCWIGDYYLNSKGAWTEAVPASKKIVGKWKTDNGTNVEWEITESKINGKNYSISKVEKEGLCENIYIDFNDSKDNKCLISYREGDNYIDVLWFIQSVNFGKGGYTGANRFYKI